MRADISLSFSPTHIMIRIFITCIATVIIHLVNAYEQTLFKTSVSLDHQACNSLTSRIFSIHANAIECAFVCAKHHGCFGSWIHVASSTCYGCFPNVNPALLTSSNVTGNGARFYRRLPKGRSCSFDPIVANQNLTSLNLGTLVYDFLVSGFLAVPDTHLSQSSYWADSFGEYRGRNARLCRNPEYGGSQIWAAGGFNTPQWIQVRFLGVSNVYAVVTGGRLVGDPQHVKTYTVRYSTDCAQFISVTDTYGINKMFAGNVDSTSLVYNVLPNPVNALCVRINPVNWYYHISMRFDVIGHTL